MTAGALRRLSRRHRGRLFLGRLCRRCFPSGGKEHPGAAHHHGGVPGEGQPSVEFPAEPRRSGRSRICAPPGVGGRTGAVFERDKRDIKETPASNQGKCLFYILITVNAA